MNKLNSRVIGSLIVSAVILTSTSIASAETRTECELVVKRNTTLAMGAGAGAVTGGLVAATTATAACSGFLAAFFIDLGLTFAACVATWSAVGAAAGTIAGTGIAEDKVNDRLRSCSKLPER